MAAKLLTGFDKGKTRPVRQDLSNRMQFVEELVDLSLIPSTSAGDWLFPVKVPPNAVVTEVIIVPRTVAGAALTANVGDANSDTTYLTAVDLNALTLVSSAKGVAEVAGKAYPAPTPNVNDNIAGNDIKVTLSGANAVAKFFILVIFANTEKLIADPPPN